MAIAHVCEGCGRDLARVRSSREPVYGLWVARCPGCGKVSARGRRTDESARRRAARVWLALMRLEVRTTGVALAVLAVTIATYAVAEWRVHGEEIAAAGWALLAGTHVLGGAFVHLAWSHHHPVARWSALCGVVLLLALAPAFAWAAQEAAARVWSPWFHAGYLDERLLAARVVAAAGLTAGAMLAGLPAAMGLQYVFEVARAARWRGRLSRARARRFTA